MINTINQSTIKAAAIGGLEQTSDNGQMNETLIHELTECLSESESFVFALIRSSKGQTVRVKLQTPKTSETT